MFFRHAEASSYYLEDDPEYDDEIDEEFEKFLLEKEAQLQWFKKENILCSFCELVKFQVLFVTVSWRIQQLTEFPF